MKKSHLEKRYKNLLKQVETDEFYTTIDLVERVNVYTCEQGHKTVTLDIDAGVTPFLIDCHECGEKAKSSFYKTSLKKEDAGFIWYRPTLEELIKIRNKSPHTVEHVLNGGLIARKIKK